jgi:diguanylate cyclase (GGDEF)-like protein
VTKLLGTLAALYGPAGSMSLGAGIIIGMLLTLSICAVAAKMNLRRRRAPSGSPHDRFIESELHRATLAAGNDSLTGLLNRRGLDAWIESNGRPPGTVLYIDLDGFKAVNDGGGHAAGDETLAEVATIVRHAVRVQDAVARFGGDEFVIYLAGENDAAIALNVVSRISSAVGLLLPLGPGRNVRIGVSIGSALVGGGVAFADALRFADADAYRIKAEHRARRRRTERAKDVAPNMELFHSVALDA